MLFTGVPADGADAGIAAIWLASLWIDHAERLNRQTVLLLYVFQNRPQRRGALRTILAHALAPLVLGMGGLRAAELRPDVEILKNRRTLERVFVPKPGMLTEFF